MSRVGKQPIILSTDIEANIADNEVLIKGQKGELKKGFPSLVKILIILSFILLIYFFILKNSILKSKILMK